MFKAPFDEICFLDIETVPCVETIRRAYSLAADVPDETVINHVYQIHGATPENPTPFLKAMFHKVISVCVLYRKVKVGAVSLKFYTLPGVTNGPAEPLSEANIVCRTLGFIGRNKAQVVGWNSAGFDQVTLFQRLTILGLHGDETVRAGVRAYCERPNKPWEGADYFARFSEANVDLMSVLAGDSGARPKLGEFAAACGIPGKIAGMDGSQVAEAYAQDRLAEIGAYNEYDVATTYLIWLRMAWIGGHLSETAYKAESRQFSELLQSRALDGAAHWEKYLEAWQGKPAAEKGKGLDQWQCTRESGGRALAMKVLKATERIEQFVAPDIWRKELEREFSEYEPPVSRKTLSASECERWVNFLNEWANQKQKQVAA